MQLRSNRPPLSCQHCVSKCQNLTDPLLLPSALKLYVYGPQSIGHLEQLLLQTFFDLMSRCRIYRQKETFLAICPHYPHPLPLGFLMIFRLKLNSNFRNAKNIGILFFLNFIIYLYYSFCIVLHYNFSYIITCDSGDGFMFLNFYD